MSPVNQRPRSKAKEQAITSDRVEPAQLLAYVCDCRRDLMPLFREDGIEDPLEPTEKMRHHVMHQTARLKEECGEAAPTQLGTAIRLMQSIIPQNKIFSVGSTCYHGIARKDGGLEIGYIDYHAEEIDTLSTLRREHGSLLPKFIIDENEPGNCVELSCLLITLLRCAGIKANIALQISTEQHAYLIANLDNITFILDPAKYQFIQTQEQGLPDSYALSAHLSNKLTFFAMQDSVDDSFFELADLILPLDSFFMRK